MRETVLKAVKGRRPEHADLAPDFIQQGLYVQVFIAGEFQVQAKIEDREFQLPKHLQAGLKAPGPPHFFTQVGGQRPAAVAVPGKQRQRLGFPAPVFHELTGQFDRVPGHAIDAGDAAVVHPGQHVMQAMAEFVEQGGDFVVGQKRGFAAHGRGEVASQVGDRMLDAAGGFFAHDALIHPGPAALAGTRVQVQVKTGPRPAVRPQEVKKQHLLMPGLDPRARLDPDAIEPFGDGEQALDHLLNGKIGPERFL